MNVHIFDRNLNKNLIDYVNNYNIEIETIEPFIDEYINKSGGVNNPAVQGINLIYNNIGDNIDTINNLDARKLLFLIIKYYNSLSDETQKNDLINILAEQMSDMYNNGQCSQGRTIRLIQILAYIIN